MEGRISWEAMARECPFLKGLCRIRCVPLKDWMLEGEGRLPTTQAHLEPSGCEAHSHQMLVLE